MVSSEVLYVPNKPPLPIIVFLFGDQRNLLEPLLITYYFSGFGGWPKLFEKFIIPFFILNPAFIWHHRIFFAIIILTIRFVIIIVIHL